MRTEGRRYPHRLRADGQPKAMQVARKAQRRIDEITALFDSVRPPHGTEYRARLTLAGGRPPAPRSAERTRSARCRAGSRRTKRMAGPR